MIHWFNWTKAKDSSQWSKSNFHPLLVWAGGGISTLKHTADKRTASAAFHRHYCGLVRLFISTSGETGRQFNAGRKHHLNRLPKACLVCDLHNVFALFHAFFLLVKYGGPILFLCFCPMTCGVYRIAFGLIQRNISRWVLSKLFYS